MAPPIFHLHQSKAVFAPNLVPRQKLARLCDGCAACVCAGGCNVVDVVSLMSSEFVAALRLLNRMRINENRTKTEYLLRLNFFVVRWCLRTRCMEVGETEEGDTLQWFN